VLEKKIDLYFEYFKKYDFSQVFPLDCGGWYVNRKILGDKTGTEAAEYISSEKAFRLWEKKDGKINWNNVEINDDSDFKSVEKTAWLNRLYFLPVLAQAAWRTGDEKFLQKWIALYFSWAGENNRNNNRINPFTWYDMQVSWRAFNLYWCYTLSQGKLSRKYRENIVINLKEHGKYLYEFIKQEGFVESNHFLLIGLVLMLLHDFFPEEDRWFKMGRKIVFFHIKDAVFSDGGLKEGSPTYLAFCLSMYRDAILIMKRRKIEIPKYAEKKLIKIIQFLESVVVPNGRLPPLNDSYELELQPFISITKKMLNIETRSVAPFTKVFHKSGICISKNTMEGEKMYMLIDFTPKGAHWHGGKSSFHLVSGNQPVFIDSGMCDYDSKYAYEWFRESKAHNSITHKGVGDAVQMNQPPNYSWAYSSIPALKHKVKKISATTSAIKLEEFIEHLGSKGAKWERTFLIKNTGEISIKDKIDTDINSTFNLNFHCAPNLVKITSNAQGALIEYPNNVFCISFLSNQHNNKKFTLKKGMVSDEGKILTNRIISVELMPGETLRTFVQEHKTIKQLK
jgi:hypothetical protein